MADSPTQILDRLIQGDELALLETARQVAGHFGRSGSDSVSFAWSGLVVRTVRDIAERWRDPAGRLSAADLIVQESRRAFWDQILSLAFAEGSACAFALLHSTILRRVAAQPGARKLEREWEDIAQEATLGLMQAWSSKQIQQSSWSLLHTIVQRRFIDFVRRGRARGDSNSEPIGPAESHPASDPRELEEGAVWGVVLERVLREGDASDWERWVLGGRAQGYSRQDLLEQLVEGNGAHPAPEGGEWTLGRVVALERRALRKVYLGLVRGLPPHPPELRRVFEAAFPVQGRQALPRVAAELQFSEERVLEMWQLGLRMLGIPS